MRTTATYPPPLLPSLLPSPLSPSSFPSSPFLAPLFLITFEWALSDTQQDPFDYKSVAHLPSFNVMDASRSSHHHTTSTSLPSRFSYALLSPVLPPHPGHQNHQNPSYPLYRSRGQRATIAVHSHTFQDKMADMPADADLDTMGYPKAVYSPSPLAASTPIPIDIDEPIVAEAAGTDDADTEGTDGDNRGAFTPRAKSNTDPDTVQAEADRLLRRSSSDSFRVPSNLRVRIPQPASVSDPVSPETERIPRAPSSPGSRLKFEMV